MLPSSDDCPPGELDVIPPDGTEHAASVLASYLFARGDLRVPGVTYAVGYELSVDQCGGDIADVYQFDNGSLAVSIADISGKGVRAAIHAALIKFALRAYSSHGLMPEMAMRAMDRLYLENAAFEDVESYATAFFGIVDVRRRVMTYASAGHEPIVLIHPHMKPQVLAPTCPMLGVFDDLHHLFRQEAVDLWPGTLLVLATDGITEARSPGGELFGMERLLATVVEHRDDEPAQVRDALVRAASAFSGDGWSDDVAVLVVRFEGPFPTETLPSAG